MRKNKENHIRSTLILVLVFSFYSSQLVFSKNLSLKVGESKQIKIDSDEQIKVKGASVHVVDLRSNQYQIVGIKKGVAIIDPTPLSRTQEPLIFEVITDDESEGKQTPNCNKLGLVCNKYEISGDIRHFNQLSFIHDQARDLTDSTEGMIVIESDHVLRKTGILSIQKFMGRRILIEMQCSEGAEQQARTYWKNFGVQVVCKEKKSRSAVFIFEIEKLNDQQKSSRSFSKNLFISAANRDESDNKILSYAEKKIIIADSTAFDFKLQSLTQEKVSLYFEIQGKIKFLETHAQVNLFAKGGSDSATDEARSENLIPYDRKTLLSETEASDQLSENFAMTPWNQIPIIGIIFKQIARSHSKLKQKISIEVPSETPFEHP